MSLRIVHFADNHLGAGTDRRQQDIIDRFSEAVDKIIELKPDLAINSGDLFHMVHPANRVIALASEQLIRLGRNPTKSLPPLLKKKIRLNL